MTFSVIDTLDACCWGRDAWRLLFVQAGADVSGWPFVSVDHAIYDTSPPRGEKKARNNKIKIQVGAQEVLIHHSENISLLSPARTAKPNFFVFNGALWWFLKFICRENWRICTRIGGNGLLHHSNHSKKKKKSINTYSTLVKKPDVWGLSCLWQPNITVGNSCCEGFALGSHLKCRFWMWWIGSQMRKFKQKRPEYMCVCVCFQLRRWRPFWGSLNVYNINELQHSFFQFTLYTFHFPVKPTALL